MSLATAGIQRISVVIPNFNYGRFLGAAVESALGLDWPDVEVIVVDDGSTDDSVAVMAGFGTRITALQQTNAGPRVACNTGFARSSGDVVIFLDSDDLLMPSIGRELDAVWYPGISKVQVEMQRIDADGDAAGGTFPQFRRPPSPEQVREWMIDSSAYPTPPGSGNAYARTFLERLLPLDDRCGDATDSACLAAAPLLGDVVTLAKPLVHYRVHGGNRSSLRSSQNAFPRQLHRSYQRQAFAMELMGTETSPGAVIATLFRSRHLLQMRVAGLRLTGSTTLPGDGRLRMARDCFTSLSVGGPEPLRTRVAGSLWSGATLLSPRRVARRLIRWRFGR